MNSPVPRWEEHGPTLYFGSRFCDYGSVEATKDFNFRAKANGVERVFSEPRKAREFVEAQARAEPIVWRKESSSVWAPDGKKKKGPRRYSIGIQGPFVVGCVFPVVSGFMPVFMDTEKQADVFKNEKDARDAIEQGGGERRMI